MVFNMNTSLKSSNFFYFSGGGGDEIEEDEDVDEENQENIQDLPSPDISLSSGPIEPLGTGKDSGSEAESSHNDVTPTHNYSLKVSTPNA